VLGPTASGKSALAVELARKFNAEVISADSRQVFKGMDLGTGKITKREMRGIPHHLLDVASPKKPFDVVRWKKLADKAVADIISRGKLPIICGGTGLYIKALTENVAYPDVPPNWKLRAGLEKKSVPALFTVLKKLDSTRAKTIDRHNPRRLVRAIEIARAIGKIPTAKIKPRHDVLLIGIRKSPAELKKVIGKRFILRISKGMIEEAKKLHIRGLSWKRMEEIGLEYKYLAFYLRGKINKEKMLEELNTKIWQYARRQMTWFRKTPNVRWISSQKKAERVVHDFLSRSLSQLS